MKTWELMEQLQGRDPSGEVVLTLSGDGFRYAANFDLSPIANRRIVLETDPEEIGVDTTALEDEVSALEDEVSALEGMVDDLQSALQKLMHATEVNMRNDTPETLAAVIQAQADAKEISRRERP